MNADRKSIMPKLKTPENDLKQKILDIALDIVESEGVRQLTQPYIVKKAGLRQSHLTYYFPKKSDLFLALLDASHQRQEQNSDDGNKNIIAILSSFFFNRERMRFFLTILLEINYEPHLRIAMKQHMESLYGLIANHVIGDYRDEDIASFVDELRGIGLRVLVDDELQHGCEECIVKLAKTHNLELQRT